jgi:hypothetical protein
MMPPGGPGTRADKTVIEEEIEIRRPAPPFAAAILQSMLFHAASQVALVMGTEAPREPRHANALRSMLQAVGARTRRDAKSATADRGTQVAIDPEHADQGSQTDKDIGGFEAHVRALAGQQALAAREVREAMASQRKEHQTYRDSLRRTLSSIEALRAQNAELAGVTECTWRLAQSRGVLGAGPSAGLSAWADTVVLPATFGTVPKDGTRELVAAVAQSLVEAEAEGESETFP